MIPRRSVFGAVSGLFGEEHAGKREKRKKDRRKTELYKKEEKNLANRRRFCYYIQAFRTGADFPHVAGWLGGGDEVPGGKNK